MNKKLHKSKIDVPVLLIFFNRPCCFSKVFEQVKKARPSKLFLYQDGAREGNENDVKCVQKCREIASNIDWECEVHTKYQQKNYGCDPSGYLARKWAFHYVDECIILEDDCVPSQSFFTFCKDLLEKYKDDERVNMICGMNNLETWDSPYSYLFTESGSICGVATWKRIIDSWDDTYSFLNEAYSVKLLENNLKSSKINSPKKIQYWKSFKDTGLAYHETIGGIEQIAQNRLNIVSTKNLIKNIGNSNEGGTHSVADVALIPKGLRKIFTMDAQSIDFPLKHPKYVINDVEFQKQLFRVMGTGHPFVRMYRNVEKALLLLRHQGLKSMINKIRKKFGA